MDKLELIRDFIELEEGNALVLLLEDGPTELIYGHKTATVEDIAIGKEAISIILDNEILDACVMPIGRKYIKHDNKLIFVDKVYTVDSDDYLSR